jgi:hypothetical protein
MSEKDDFQDLSDKVYSCIKKVYESDIDGLLSEARSVLKGLPGAEEIKEIYHKMRGSGWGNGYGARQFRENYDSLRNFAGMKRVKWHRK